MAPAAISHQAAEPEGTPAGMWDTQEAALVDRCRQDQRAFGEVYRTQYVPIVGYLLRRTGDPHAAEDLAAETFICAMNSIGGFRMRGVPLRAWLYRIASNQANRWARARRSELKGLGVGHVIESAACPRDQADQAEQLLLSRLAFGRLSGKDQTVLALHYFEQLSIAQVATALGWREGTVKARLFRARASLRAELERLDAGRENT